MDITKRLNKIEKPTGFNISCNVNAVHTRDGEILSNQNLHNIVVNGGLNYIVGRIASTAITDYANYIGLGLSALTPSITATNLTGAWTGSSGLERATGAVSAPAASIGMFSVAKTFTCATANASVGAAGLYTQATDNLFAGVALSSPVVLQPADTLAITWVVEFS
jgi:hypothetical protein